MPGQGEGGRIYLTWPNPSCILYIVYLYICSNQIKTKQVFYINRCLFWFWVCSCYFFTERFNDLFCYWGVVRRFYMIPFKISHAISLSYYSYPRLVFLLVFCLSICRRAKDNLWTVGPLISCILFVLQVVGLFHF